MVDLIPIIVAGWAGAVCHELAHWLIWRLAGRNPKLHLRKLYVEPRSGSQDLTMEDRFAAAAPYLIGIPTAALGVYQGEWIALMFGAAMVGIPSRVDLATIGGIVTWDI